MRLYFTQVRENFLLYLFSKFVAIKDLIAMFFEFRLDCFKLFQPLNNKKNSFPFRMLYEVP